MKFISFKSNISKLYAYWFFHNLIFAYVIERLFGLERGLTIQEMIYVEITYAVIAILLEVPTGVIADRWSRKNMMILSAFFVFFEFFILIFAHNVWMFMLSALSAAIGGALASGTSNALFYDSLKASEEEKDYEKVIGRNELFDSTAGIIAALVGAWIGSQFGLSFTYQLSLISCLIAFGIAFTLKDPPLKTSTEEVTFWKHLKEAWLFLKNHQALQFIILYGTLIGATWIYIDEYWQIYLHEVGISIVWFGIISILFRGIHAFSGLLSYRLKKYFNYQWVFSILLLLTIGSIFVASILRSPWGLIPLLLAYSGFYFTKPLLSGYLHHRIDSKHRATIDSFQSFVLNLGSIGVGLLFGYFSTQFSIFGGLAFLGFLLLGYSFFYLPLQFKYIKEKKSPLSC